MMKKWSVYILFALISPLFYFLTAQAGNFGIGVTPSQIEKGGKVTIRVWADGTFPENPQPANHISLFVTDKDQSPPSNAQDLCQRANNPGSMHLKMITESIGASGDTYIWDTQAEGTSEGKHYIIAALMASDRNTACDPSNVIRINYADYSVSAGDSINPPGGTDTTPPDIKFPNLAIDPPKGSGGAARSELNADNFVTILFKDLIKRFLEICAAFALLALVYSGIMYITSAGNPQRAEAAKKNLIWAIIGVAVILLGLLIVNIIPTILS